MFLRGMSRCRHFFTSAMALGRPTFDGKLPPKRYQPPFMLYYMERTKSIGGGKKVASSMGKEWREMSPEDKLKYEETSKKLKEDYQRDCQRFYESFANEEEKKMYLDRLTSHRSQVRAYLSNMRRRRHMRASRKPVKYSAFSIMVKERCLNIPKEDRKKYLLKQGSADYKSLTEEELERYQKMADTIQQQRMKEYEQRTKMSQE